MKKALKVCIRCLVPIAIHFVLSEVILYVAYLWFSMRGEDASALFGRYGAELTGISGIVVMIPCVFLYQRDVMGRLRDNSIPSAYGQDLVPGELVMLMLMGASLALYGNVLMSFVTMVVDPEEYNQSIQMLTYGKTIWQLLLWVGFLAPIAEEMVFRWLVFLRLRDHMAFPAAAVISGLLFGLYHGNLVQAIYAGVLGAFFAFLTEYSGNIWSGVFAHIGANFFSLLYGEYGEMLSENHMESVMGGIFLVLFLALVGGIVYFGRRGRERQCRAV